jgi:HK97 family phage prohead protease
MREQRKVSVPLEIKSIEPDGRFAGYASVFDMTDNQRDRVLRGAFRETLKGRVREVKLLWQHDQAEPIGVFTQMFEDQHGLYVEGRLLMQVARAREAYALLKEGVLSGLSIGYSPLRYSTEPDTGVRLLHRVALWEVSLVTFPANEASRVNVVKSDAYGALDAALARAMGALA